jgi:hypothetical protein
VSESSCRIRFGSCKRNPDKLLGSIESLRKNAQAFLKHHAQYSSWQIEFVAIAPQMPSNIARQLESKGVIAQSLAQLMHPLIQPKRQLASENSAI